MSKLLFIQRDLLEHTRNIFLMAFKGEPAACSVLGGMGKGFVQMKMAKTCHSHRYREGLDLMLLYRIFLYCTPRKMERCLLEERCYISVLGVGVFCEIPTLHMGYKCRTRDVNHCLSGIPPATERTVLLRYEFHRPRDKAPASVSGN